MPLSSSKLLSDVAIALSLTAVMSLLLFTLAAADEVFEITHFANPLCTGRGNVSKTPVGQCLPTNNSKVPSVYFNISTEEYLWAIVNPATTGKNCEHHRGEGEVPIQCGLCTSSGLAHVGHYQYDCDHKANSVVAKDDCDDTCTKCKHSRTIPVGTCFHYNNGTDQMYLGGIRKAQIVSEVLYRDSVTCGSSGTEELLMCGGCYGGTRFNCTLTNTKGSN